MLANGFADINEEEVYNTNSSGDEQFEDALGIHHHPRYSANHSNSNVPPPPHKSITTTQKLEFYKQELETAENALLDACMQYEEQVSELTEQVAIERQINKVETLRFKETEESYTRIHGSLKRELFLTTEAFRTISKAGKAEDTPETKRQLHKMEELIGNLSSTLEIVRSQLAEEEFHKIQLRMERDKLKLERDQLLKDLAIIKRMNEEHILEDMPFNRTKQEKRKAATPGEQRDEHLEDSAPAAAVVATKPTVPSTTPVTTPVESDRPTKSEGGKPKPLDLSVPFDRDKILFSRNEDGTTLLLDSKETGVYIRNIPEHLTDASLYTLLKNFNVLKIIKRGSRASVTFGSHTEAQYLCDRSNTGVITLGDNTLKIKIRQNKRSTHNKVRRNTTIIAPPNEEAVQLNTSSEENGKSSRRKSELFLL